MLFKNSVRTSKRTPHFTITKINWLIQFNEKIAVFSWDHTKPINYKIAKLLIVKAGGTYSFHQASEV
jgi:hypothetical protein